MAAVKYLKLVSGVFTEGATTDDLSVGSIALGGAGTALSVTNNASIGGTLGVTGAATLSGGGTLSGTLNFQGATLAAGTGGTISGAVTASGAWSLTAAGTALAVTNNATVGGTLSAGATTVGSLNASSGGITNAGAISGATTISASGAVTVGSLNAGSGTIQTTGSVSAGSLSAGSLDHSGTITIGTSSASGVTIGKSGLTTTVAGSLTVSQDLVVNGTETIVGGTTFSSQLNLGPVADATSGTTTQSSVLLQGQYSYWNGTAAVTANGYAFKVVPQSAAASVGDLQFIDAGSTERARLVAGDSMLRVNKLDALASGALTIGGATATSISLADNTSVTGTLSVSSTSTFTGAATFSGAVNLNGGATVQSGGTVTITGATLAAGTGATVSGTVTMSGAVTFSAAGTALSVTNNASIGGSLTVTGTATLNGSIVLNGDETFSPSGTATGTTTTFASHKSVFQYSYWNGSAAVVSSGYSMKVVPSSAAAGVGDLQFLDADTTERMRLTAGSSATVKVNNLDALAAGALTLGGSTATSISLAKNTSVTGTLSVSSTSTLTGAVTMSSTLSVSSTATVTGAVYANGGIARSSAGTLTIGNDANSSAITFGKASQTTTMAGTLALSATSGNALTTAAGSTSVFSGQLNGTNGGFSTGLAAGTIDASGYGGIAASASAALNIGTDSAKTGAVNIGRSGQTVTIQGNLTVNGTVSGSASNSAAVVITGFTADTGGVTAYQAVKVSSADKVLAGQADSQVDATVVGFASVTAAAGVAVGVITQGVVTPIKESAQTWNPGDRIYLSATTAGALTNVAPSGSGIAVQQVGVAKNNTDMVINIMPTAMLG